MKKSEVKVGACYAAKVGSGMGTVRIDRVNPQGGWDGMNLRTNRAVRIKTASCLRGETRAPGRVVTKAEYEAEAGTATSRKKDIAKSVDAVAKGDLTKGVTVPTSRGKKPAGKAKAKAAKGTKPAKAAKEKKPGGLDAAATVLAESGRPMQAKEIVKTALRKGYWKTEGKTPEATIYAAIIREIAVKGKASRFRRAEVTETREGKKVALRGYFELGKGA